MDEVVNIIEDIKKGKIKPIYFLMGEEPYFIDKITNYIEEHLLAEDEKGFNQVVYYGKDVTIEEIVAAAKRFPMMAERQVVIIKEAQELSKTIEKLESYAKNPQPSTVLVFAYKYKTLDKRKALSKNILENGILFESKKLYENKMAVWLNNLAKSKNLSIEPKANALLIEFLGTDLSRLDNEMDKLSIILAKGTTITSKDIEDNIGFSKDFNLFELRSAIGERNQIKAYKIAHYLAKNQKENPFVLSVGLLFSYFSQVLQYHGLKDKSPATVARVLRINPYFVKDYETAYKNYPMKKVSQIIAAIRDADAKSKGVGAHQIEESDLYKQLLVTIFN